MMTYMRPIWIDLGKGRIWNRYICDVPPPWVVWLTFQSQWSGDATMSPHGLPSPTLVSGSIYDI